MWGADSLEIQSTEVDRRSPFPCDSACFREWARLMAGKSPESIEDAMIAATARVHEIGSGHPE
jgi:hypothetical protein